MMQRAKDGAADYYKKVKAFVAAGLSDGCTGVPDFNVSTCCDTHDFDYYDLSKSKWKADYDFLKCMLTKAKKKGFTVRGAKTAAIGLFYYSGVTVAGWLFWKGKQDETRAKLDALSGPIGSDRL